MSKIKGLASFMRWATLFSLLIKGDFEAFRLLTSKIVLDIVVVGCDFSHVKKVLTTFVSRNPNQFHTKKR